MLGPLDILMFAFYVLLAGLAVVADLRDPVWSVALGLSAACAALWVLARLQLGRSFSVRPEARRLVTTGLYARFRHPIYVFGTAAFLFVLLALQGWAGLAFWVILIPVQVLRARREERLLADTFGADYRAYRDSTWF